MKESNVPAAQTRNKSRHRLDRTSIGAAAPDRMSFFKYAACLAFGLWAAPAVRPVEKLSLDDIATWGGKGPLADSSAPFMGVYHFHGATCSGLIVHSWWQSVSPFVVCPCRHVRCARRRHDALRFMGPYDARSDMQLVQQGGCIRGWPRLGRLPRARHLADSAGERPCHSARICLASLHGRFPLQRGPHEGGRHCSTVTPLVRLF